jgi:hypothetical protein
MNDDEILAWVAEREVELRRWQAKLQWLREQVTDRAERRREEQFHGDVLEAWTPETGGQVQ